MEPTTVVFFDRLNRLIIAQKVKSEGNLFYVQHAMMFCIRDGGLALIPLDTINEKPDVRIQHTGIMKDNSVLIEFPFKEDEVAYVECSDRTREQYINVITPPAARPPVVAQPTNTPNGTNIVNLFEK